MSETKLLRSAAVSHEIIVRHERAKVLSFVEVAKKIADALEVSLDYLAGEEPE